MQPLWKHYRDSKKIKCRITQDPAIPLLDTFPNGEKAGTHADSRTPVFIEALFTVARRWKQLKCLSTDEGINNMGCVPTMDYLALKSKKIRTHATT